MGSFSNVNSRLKYSWDILRLRGPQRFLLAKNQTNGTCFVAPGEGSAAACSEGQSASRS